MIRIALKMNKVFNLALNLVNQLKKKIAIIKMLMQALPISQVKVIKLAPKTLMQI